MTITQLFHNEIGVLAIIFALDKFKSYLIGAKVFVFTGDAKPRLIRYICLLQEFDLIIKGKKTVKNVVIDHLLRLVHDQKELPLNGSFPKWPTNKNNNKFSSNNEKT